MSGLLHRQKFVVDDADQETPYIVAEAVAGHRDPNEEFSGGGTVLMWAAGHKSKKAVDRLLALGADVNRASGSTGGTPLMMAAEAGAAGIVQQLLEAGAKVDARMNKLGRTALHLACWEGHADVVKLLLDHGARVNDSDAVSTPLMDAAASRHLGIMQLLLDAGADPCMCAADTGGGALISLFQLRTAPGGAYFALDETDVLRGVEMLLNAGADPNNKTKTGATALMAAARSNLPEVCRRLLEAGADPTVADSDGDTAAAWARMNGHQDLAAMLTEAAAPPVPKPTPRPPASQRPAVKDDPYYFCMGFPQSGGVDKETELQQQLFESLRDTADKAPIPMSVYLLRTASGRLLTACGFPASAMSDLEGKGGVWGPTSAFKQWIRGAGAPMYGDADVVSNVSGPQSIDGPSEIVDSFETR